MAHRYKEWKYGEMVVGKYGAILGWANGLASRDRTRPSRFIRVSGKGDNQFFVHQAASELETQSLGQPTASGSTGSAGASLKIYIPLSTMRTRFGNTTRRSNGECISSETVELHELMVRVSGLDRVSDAAARLDPVETLRHE